MTHIDCTTAERWIVMDLDEGLDEEKRTLLQEHIGRCDICAQTQAETSVLLSRFTSDVPEDPGEEFWARYYSSLGARLQEKEPPRSWALWWKPAAAFAMVALAILAFMVSEFRPGRVQQALDQVALNPALIAELDSVYGPDSEEWQDPAPFLSGQGQFWIGSVSSTLEDEPFQWFEVEDEPNHLFL